MRAPSLARKKITPNNLTAQDSGQIWSTYQVALPEDVSLDDIGNDPELFSGLRLRPKDVLFCIAYDNSWAIETRVVAVSPDRVTLGKINVAWKGVEAPAEWSDDNYEIRWAGSGYEVIRRGSGVTRPDHVVESGFQSLEAAKQAVARRYPQKVA